MHQSQVSRTFACSPPCFCAAWPCHDMSTTEVSLFKQHVATTLQAPRCHQADDARMCAARPLVQTHAHSGARGRPSSTRIGCARLPAPKPTALPRSQRGAGALLCCPSLNALDAAFTARASSTPAPPPCWACPRSCLWARTVALMCAPAPAPSCARGCKASRSCCPPANRIPGAAPSGAAPGAAASRP